ncbi:hypothetical protein [Calothrix sp. NIES-2100]|uniref:hypothetical protein n=1 Tax=Calothrix sp. NIES-2100 TaxID=1954172 RepID=UPI0030DC6B78
MQALRPHLVASEFVTRIRRQEQQGFQLAYLEDEASIKAVAGFRIGESLSSGKFLYVDDLVTRESDGFANAFANALKVMVQIS